MDVVHELQHFQRIINELVENRRESHNGQYNQAFANLYPCIQQQPTLKKKKKKKQI